jgi:hypothetical protein
MRPYRLFLQLALGCVGFSGVRSAQPQAPKQTYAQIKSQPSAVHWCVAEAGDDPAHIISKSCEVYSECLGAVDLNESIDRPPFSGLPDDQIKWVRKCHQDLYNAAHSNPQVKGSRATQDWLEHGVYPGTEAKSFPIPSSLPSPK